ncbi:MAG: hypothetical protein PVH19_11915, partial [Planctomycetia bacterium]
MSRFITFLLLITCVCLSAVVAQAGTSDSGSLYFSSSLITDRISQPVDQTEPVHENIMDTPITGKTRLHGTITPSLVANQSAGQLRILLKAHSASRTTGTHWPVVIHDQTTGKLVGSIDVLLNGLDFTTEHENAAVDIHVTNQQVQSQVGSSRWVLSI